MIAEGQMNGMIDPIDRIVQFEAKASLPTWDEQIQRLCHLVNGILDKIEQVAPDWTSKAYCGD